MALQHWLKYGAWMSAYNVRRRIPLYADDRSKIFTRAAQAILGIITLPDNSFSQKYRFFRRYARRFTMPVSRQNMVEALSTMPNLDAFQSYIETHIRQDKYAPELIGFYDALKADLDRFKRSGGAKPQFCHLDRNAEGFNFRPAEPLNASLDDAIILAAPGAILNQQILPYISTAKKLTIIGPIDTELSTLAEQLKAYLHPAPIIDTLIPARTYLSPYSKANALASQTSHDVSADIVRAVSKARPSLSRLMRGGLNEDIQLALSDRFYRFFQLVLGFEHAVQDQETSRPIIVLPSPALSYSAIRNVIARHSLNPFYAIELPGKIGDELESSPADIFKGQQPSKFRPLLNASRAIRQPLRKSLNAIFAAGRAEKKDQIIIAASHGNVKYRDPVNSICEALSPAGQVNLMQTFPPKGRVALSRAGVGANLHMALTPKRAAYWMGYRPELEAFLKTVLADHSLGRIALSELSGAIADMLIGRMDAFWAIIGAHRVAQSLLSRRRRPIALGLVPGRDPALRAIARAFLKAQRPVVDIQILFVSALGRYARPVTPICTVIDNFARDHYVKGYGMDPDHIHMIGTVNLDEDMRRGKALSRAAARQILFHRNLDQKKVILFAAQPIAQSDLIDSVSALGAYLKERTDVWLAVKLHPSHDEGLREQLQNVWQASAGPDASRAIFIRDEYPFYQFLPASDVMLTYFSNVGLLAPAFDMPLIALPCKTDLPSENLVSMGLATSLSQLEELGPILDKALGGELSSRGSRYVKENPHMEVPSALPRLKAIFQDLLSQQPYR